MRVLFKRGLIVLSAEGEADRAALAAFASDADDHVFHVRAHTGEGCALVDLGARDEACRTPINIISSMPHPQFRLIGNLAPTPFILHGRPYASVEGFWQGLKFARADERARVAGLSGSKAKRAAHGQDETATIIYEGVEIPVGRPEHWALMRQACEAKFAQHAGARAALLATGQRLLTHKTRRDSRTIPGVVMADIWTNIRTLLQQGELEIAGGVN